jgi:hypothetical protein
MLVLCQINDLELETNEPILRAICASLELEDETNRAARRCGNPAMENWRA